MPTVSKEPQKINIVLYAGDGVGIKFTATDSNGAVVPLDGDVISQIRTTRSDADPLVTFAVDDSQFAQGIVVLSLTGEETASLISTPGTTFTGVWDLQYTPTGAEPITLVQGKVRCDPDVTR